MKLKKLFNTTALAGLAGLSILTAANQAFASILGPLTAPNPTIVQGTNVQFSFVYAPAKRYVLQGKTDLTNTNWVNITTNLANPAGQVVLTDTNAVNLYPNRYYRIGML